MRLKINPRVAYTFVSAAIILLGTLVAIEYAKGAYRLTNKGVVPQSGLLAANSFPTGAEVSIDGQLVSATDDTLYLEPGTYQVEISKEGYTPWRKQLQVEQELVTQTNALLFPQVPSLNPLTVTGVDRVWPSPDGQKVLFYTASASSELRNGLYVLELSDSLLSLQKGPRQVSPPSSQINFATAQYIWSPDSSEVYVDGETKDVVLDISRKDNITILPNVALDKKNILARWEEEMAQRERQFLSKFPPEMMAVATQSATNVYMSPDKKRLLFTATAAATLSEEIVPPIPARSTQPQVRQLEPGGIYVYDREEDTNFIVGYEADFVDEAALTKRLLVTDVFTRQLPDLTASESVYTSLQASDSATTARQFATYHTPLLANTLQWFPDSKHLLYSKGGQVHVIEYDGSNDVPVYSGPFNDNFIYPWPDGSKLVILTAFSAQSPANLYAVELR